MEDLFIEIPSFSLCSGQISRIPRCFKFKPAMEREYHFLIIGLVSDKSYEAQVGAVSSQNTLYDFDLSPQICMLSSPYLDIKANNSLVSLYLCEFNTHLGRIILFRAILLTMCRLACTW